MLTATNATPSTASTNGHATSPAGSAATGAGNATYQQLLTVADRMYRQDPDWVTFFREVLGIEGVVRRTLPSFDDLTEFEKSGEYAEIQKMLVRLRENKASADTESEPTRVITVRLPKSMHEYLRTEAHDLRTSMNKLCISKLLQVVDQEMVPADQTVAPKRRTSPAPVVASAAPTETASGYKPAY
ncbi:MAG: hypothetical protein ACRCT8_16575 [Lacipirellulaceae bacterium]